jgi:acetyl-CoA synthetase
MWCTADIGWVTGHTYALYGILLNGATTLIYEGALNFPKADRYLRIIENNDIEVFYTAPTALRIFALDGKKYTKKFGLKSLKVLGTVGEPIDEETWLWYFDNIGKKRRPIIDTWWQTETGGTLINALPGVGPFIPTFAGKSFPGTKHKVVNEKGKKVKGSKEGLLVQLPPYAPGMLRGIWKNPQRYKKYFKCGMYFTGDNAFCKNGEFRILGRADDIIKIAGHRLSTAEIENIIDSHPFIAESAVVSRPEKIKGEAIVVFVKLNKGKKVGEKEIIKLVAEKISPIAKPSEVYFVDGLPKTRSGKIMRRILKALLKGEKLKALSTLVNPECVEKIKKLIE